MIYVGDWPCELIIWLLGALENNIGEVDEVMFQNVERPCEHIFCILVIEKSTWTKLLK
jgi:hypothetical protein